MGAWMGHLLTLLGVALGAVASFVSTQWLERTRWQRDEAVRWDTKRLDCYTEFATAIKRFIAIAQRLAAGLGLPATAQALTPLPGCRLSQLRNRNSASSGSRS